MSSNILWAAAAASSRIHLYKTNSTENDTQSDQFMKLNRYLSCNPEIDIKRLSEKQICIQWPESNTEIREKIIAQLRQAGILMQDIQGNAKKISGGVCILEENNIPLTKDLFNLLTANEKYADEIAYAVLVLHRAGIPLKEDVLKLLTESGKPFEMSRFLEEFHLAHFSSTEGDFQLLLSKKSSLYELLSALRILRENNIPLTRGIFLLLALNKEHAIKISRAVAILHQANVPLTTQIRQLLRENAEMIALVIEKMNQENIELTEEIYAFLENANNEYSEMENLARKYLLEKNASLNFVLSLNQRIPQIHANALFGTITTFHSANNTPIPSQTPKFLAANGIHALVPIFKRLHDEKIPITNEILKLLTIDSKKISEELLELNTTPSEELFALMGFSNQARFAAIGRIFEYLAKSNAPLTPEMQDFLLETADAGIGLMFEHLQLANIPLSLEIRELISKTYETRIYAVSKEIANSNFPLTPENRDCMATIASFPLLTKAAIEQLHSDSIPITPHIISYLIKVNEMHSLALVWNSSRLLKEGIPLNLQTLEEMITGEYLHFQTPASALLNLQEAGIALSQKTLDAITAENGVHILTIGYIICFLAQKGILTQENFNSLVAGYGTRVPTIWEKLGDTPLDQAAWNKIISEIEENEWKPCAEAATVLAQRNRILGRNDLPGRLPPEIIGQIAGYLAPPGITHYNYFAEAVAGAEETRILQCDSAY